MQIQKSTILLLLFIISAYSFGQTSITAYISSSENNTASYINILVHPKNDASRIISFAISDENGNFRLEFTSKDDSVGISTRSLTHRDTTIWVANKNQNLKLTLPVYSREIKEITVNSRPITSTKDTITYLVSAFAQIKDQSIGDVIGKMPGFEVDPDGKIYYQGNPIQKYYIEGLDLLENRYVIANKNLPYESVGSVEVLENHQPIKALQSNTFSNGTSLNLKLKKNVAITGTARMGIGLPFLLHDTNITPMLFNSKQQIIATFQSNNIGDDLNSQNQPLHFSNGVLEGIGNLKPELLSITTISKPLIDRQRYMNNNAKLLSYNQLLRLNLQTEIKVNASFYHDKQQENGNKTTTYFLNNEDLTITEATYNQYFNTSLNANFTLTQNAEKRYLKNQFSINRFWDYEKGVIMKPDRLEQKAETPHISVSNLFDLLIPKKKNFFRVYSLVDYNNSPQKLIIWPGVFKNELNWGQNYLKIVQNYVQEEIVGQQYLRFTISQKPWAFDTESGFNFGIIHQKSFIEKDDLQLTADSLKNNYKWYSYEVYITENFRYEKNNLKFGLELPLRLLNYELKESFHNSIEPTQKFLFSPRFWINFDFNAYLSGNASVKNTSNIGDAGRLTQGYIITDYRNMQKQSAQPDERKAFSYNMSIRYKNPVSGIFTSLSWNHNKITKGLIYRNKISGNGLYFYEAIESENQSFSDNLMLENSLYISSRKITLGLKGNYLKNKREYLLNDTRAWLNNHVLLIQPSIGFNRWTKVGLDYNLKLSFMVQQNAQAKSCINSQTHKFSFYYYPSEKHWLGADMEYYLTNQKNQSGNEHFFANISYNFKPNNGRLKYKIKFSNIFNSSEIVDYRYSDISIFENHYQIRQREIMLTVFFALNRAQK